MDRLTTTFLLFIGCILTAFISGCDSSISSGTTSHQQLPEKIDYNFHIKPILSDRCYACHGPDENAIEAGLRLDTEERAFAALKESEGFAIVKGKPQESELIHRIFSEDEEYLMPPPESELSLSDTEKELLKRWIEQGAEWKQHWAFIPPEKPDLPKVKRSTWAANEIDYFVLAKQQEKGLKPAKEAPKTQWLRRVYFDITGLPPAPGDIEAFLEDDSEKAYEKVVDGLLASPAYGERMASVWLDVARYADSHGYQDDRPRTMWPWRDWVVKAFNENLPYDKFVTYQLAGDLLPNPSYEQKLATGFNRNHAITQEGGVVQEEYLTEYAADRVNTFSTAFLGLTIECARCHTHKYDPITQKEYYSLMSFFNNISERGQISYFDESPTPNLTLQDPVHDSMVSEVSRWIDRKEGELEKFKDQPQANFAAWLESTPSSEQLSERVEEALLTRFSLDEPKEGLYESDLPNRPTGRMNINLPENIPFPSVVDGKKGKALAFEGRNFLSLGEIGDFEWYDAFSFGGWISYTESYEKNRGIFARRNGEQKRQGYDLVLTPQNRLAFRIIHQYAPKTLKNKKANGFALDVQTQQRITKGSWQHVFVTYDGSGKAEGMSIYINGEKQPVTIAFDKLENKTITNGNDFLVGNWNHRSRETGTLLGFKGGRVDEPIVYARELSPVEVRLLAGNTQKPQEEEWYAHFLQEQSDFLAIKYQLDSLRRIDISIPKIMVMKEVDTVKNTFLLDRGAYDAPTEPVFRATPAAVREFPDTYPQNRLGLAQWLFDDNNPLTARVMVNRLWQLYFGQGFVSTPEDFGNQGAFPTHPELLDYLAVHFRENGWDVKTLVKKIVLSSTYRQDAAIKESSFKKDPDNTWLSRGPAQRLMAEMLRDQALAASGLYFEKLGGKWVKPYQPAGIWKELANQIGENKYRPSRGRDLYRRSLYSYWKRTIPPPTMLTFDASERAVCTVKRQETSTPLQALILLNSPLYLEASRKLAEHAMLAGDELEGRIIEAFSRVLSREPQKEELALLSSIFSDEQARFSESPEEASQLLAVGESPTNEELGRAQLAAMTVVVNTIFNLDEAKYK